MDRVRFVGVDEAGYGPNLGPLVVAAVVIDAPADWESLDWWELLSPCISRRPDAEIVIDDSKKLFATPAGRLAARRTIASLMDSTPPTSSIPVCDLVQPWSIAGFTEWTQEHWFDCATECSLPESNSFVELLKSRDAVLCDVAVDVVFPRRFNQRLEVLDNKSAVEMESVLALLQRAKSAPTEQIDRMNITVDRLGGRKDYRCLVEDLAGDCFVGTRQETPAVSRYFFSDKRNCEIQFKTKADSSSLPVALASVIAKFLREEAMKAFNIFWCRRLASLKPTAGYPDDAARFWNAIAESWEELARPKDEIWRRR